MPSKLSLPGRDHETWFELSKFLSCSRSSYPSFTVFSFKELSDLFHFLPSVC